MHWYEKLSQYFPIEEMKSREHMEGLLRDQGDIYHKDEGPHHVLMYVEVEDFIFVDYVLVAKEARGQGLGRKLLDKLKERGKPIILEVEPLDYEDTNTVKRRRFYAREGFRHAETIAYRRRSLATEEVVDLEILYWTPDPALPESALLEPLRLTYERIHTYRDRHFYGASYAPVEEVVKYAKPMAA